MPDVGVAGPKPPAPPVFFRDARVADGTASLARGAAMDTGQFEAAWRVGALEADAAIDDGAALLIAGEMGIGNTTAAAALTALLTGLPAAEAVGRGAGADAEMVATKTRIVADAVARVAPGLAGDSTRVERCQGAAEVGRDLCDERARLQSLEAERAGGGGWLAKILGVHRDAGAEPARRRPGVGFRRAC